MSQQTVSNLLDGATNASGPIHHAKAVFNDRIFTEEQGRACLLTFPETDLTDT